MASVSRSLVRSSRLRVTPSCIAPRGLVRTHFTSSARTQDDVKLSGHHLQNEETPFSFSKSPFSLPSSGKTAGMSRGEFAMPLGTSFRATSFEAGMADAAKYARALKIHGVAAVSMGFDDPKSQFLVNLVDAMGCHPDSHSETEGVLWDIKYKPEGVKSTGSDNNVHSRSHSLGEFDWHTDASFEPELVRYFGFHILHTDKMGGGIFRVLPANDLTQHLSPDAIEMLLKTEFDVQVPLEFYKGIPSIRAKLLSQEPGTGNLLVRFRRDILPDPPSNDPRANAAVRELMALLSDPDGPDGVGQTLPSYVFNDNVLLFMDNARFLHSRTSIKDPKRWLRRVRFRGNPGATEGAQPAI